MFLFDNLYNNIQRRWKSADLIVHSELRFFSTEADSLQTFRMNIFKQSPSHSPSQSSSHYTLMMLHTLFGTSRTSSEHICTVKSALSHHLYLNPYQAAGMSDKSKMSQNLQKLLNFIDGKCTCDMIKGNESLVKNSISIFLHHCLTTSICFILMQTPLQLDIWLQSYTRFDNAKNNIKQRNLNPVFANISKTTSPTSDSFLLIMSHLNKYQLAYYTKS